MDCTLEAWVLMNALAFAAAACRCGDKGLACALAGAMCAVGTAGMESGWLLKASQGSAAVDWLQEFKLTSGGCCGLSACAAALLSCSSRSNLTSALVDNADSSADDTEFCPQDVFQGELAKEHSSFATLHIPMCERLKLFCSCLKEALLRAMLSSLCEDVGSF